MKLGDLAKVQNPISGKEFSLFDVGAIFSLILGGVVLIGATAASQNIAKKVEQKLKMDMTIDKFTQDSVKPMPGKIRV